MAVIQIVLVIVAIFAIGIFLGVVCQKDLQKNYCTRCSCRSYCNIGKNVHSEINNDDLIPVACQKR